MECLFALMVIIVVIDLKISYYSLLCFSPSLGINLWDILSSYAAPNIYVFVVPQGVHIPHDLILLHERGDHFSLQTSIPCSPQNLNSRLSDFMSDKIVLTKEEFFSRYPLE